MPSPAYTLAHVFLPNLIKLKGTATVIGAIERKEKVFFDALWQQAYVTHNPTLVAQKREPYRIGVITLPPPKDMGEAHMAAMVVKNGDASFFRYFTLEHDYVLKTKSDRTLVCEREGSGAASKHTKHFDGPPVTGTADADAAAFIDAFMELIVPTRVKQR